MAHKHHIHDGIIYQEYCAGLKVIGFVDKNDQRTKLFIPKYVYITIKGKPCKWRVEDIETSAFENSNNLEQVELPDSLRFIGGYAFAGCKNLRQVATSDYDWSPETVSIMFGAFLNCAKLETVKLRKPISYLCSSVFKGCPNLRLLQAYIKDSAKEAFSECKITELLFDDECEIHGKSIEMSNLERIHFVGNLKYVPISTMRWIRKRGITISCLENSNLQTLAYDGYKVETYSK